MHVLSQGKERVHLVAWNSAILLWHLVEDAESVKLVSVAAGDASLVVVFFVLCLVFLTAL